MPNVALISDLHGNIDPLEAVFRDIDRQQVEEIDCLGDIVGHGVYQWKLSRRSANDPLCALIGNQEFPIVHANLKVLKEFKFLMRDGESFLHFKSS